MDRDALKKVIQNWFVWASGFTSDKVIWSDQSSPRPQPPYATLKLLSGPNRYGINDAPVAAPAQSTSILSYYDGQRNLTLSCQVFGAEQEEDVISKLTLARDMMQTVESRKRLRQRQLDIIQVLTVQALVDYTITVDGVEVKITSDASPTAEEIRDALISEINSTAYVDMEAEAGASADLLDLSGNTLGLSYLVELDSKLTFSSRTSAIDLAPIYDMGISIIPALVDTDWEIRASMDILFGHYAHIADAPGIIEHAEITGLIDGLTIDIEV